MLLGRRPHTVDDRRRWVVRYSDYLSSGNLLSSATATTTSMTASVDGVALSADKKSVIFFTNDGELNETFTVSIEATLEDTQILNDTAEFDVVAA